MSALRQNGVAKSVARFTQGFAQEHAETDLLWGS